MPRILLVDDDHDILELGCALLAEVGYETFTADSVRSALLLLKDIEVDMLITDANMPGLTGFDLIRTLKRDKRHCEITFVMLTGRRERKDIERAVEIGIHDYIVKPLDPMLFLQKVSDLLEKPPANSLKERKAA